MALYPLVPGGLLFAQNGAGTPNTGTTAAGTATLLSQRSTTYPLPVLDQGYFQPMSGIARSIKVVARGVISLVSAGSVQTLVAGCAFATSDTATIGTTLAATGTITPATSQAVTTAIWELELDITATNVGTSAAMQALGLFTIANTTATLGTLAGTMTVGAGGSATVVMSTEQANYLQIYSTWGASNTSVSNTMTCYQVYIFAMN
jgi:hypothetical protein